MRRCIAPGRRAWVGVVALASALACMLAVAAPPTRNLDLQSFTQDRGLASLAANVVLRDAHGVVWVGTDAGLFRFDGHGFVALETQFDPSELRVNDLYPAVGGGLWIGAARGVYRWRAGVLRRVADLAVDDVQRITGDGDGGIYLRHQHALWRIAADGGVTRVAWPRALRPGALTDGPVHWFQGHLWTSCGARLCERLGSGTRLWGPARGVPDDAWLSLRTAPDGSLWVGGAQHLLHLRANAERFEVIASADPVEHLAFDADGRVLTSGRGRIQRWNGRAWRAFGDDEHLQSAQIRDLAFDPAGALWLATGGRGVLRWRGYGHIVNWTRAQGLDSVPTWAIARDADGMLWFGNQRYGNRLAPGANTLQAWPKALLERAWVDAMALLPQGRRMWIVLNHGSVLRYDLDTHRVQVVARDLGWAKFAMFGPRGRLWLGTHGRLYRIDAPADAAPTISALDTGLPADTHYLCACVDARGRFWLATSHGLLRVQAGRVRVVALDGLPDAGLVDVASTADGRLWLASDRRGLWWARASDAERLSVHGVNDTLLARTTLYALDVDGDGQLWAASGAGMDVRTEHGWRRLDRDDGLVWNDVSPGAFHVDADGSVWIGTSGGVSHVLAPARLSPRPVPAPVVLDARYGVATVPSAQAAPIAWSGQALSIALARTGLAHPGSEQLQYRLIAPGDDGGHWEGTRTPVVRFAALPPGTYRFEARWWDASLRRHSPVTAIELALAPPWWRSRWAWAVYLLTVCVLAWAAMRLRHAHLLRRQAELERLVQARTQALRADKHALEAARLALQYEASHDALTGLLNRGAVVEALVQAMVDAIGRERPLAVVLIDLDHFKRINDGHGHLAGDAVLVQTAHRLSQLVGGGVALGRYGGEEFLLVWPELAVRQDLRELFAPVIEAVCHDGDTRLHVTCSVGVAWARHGDDVGSVLRRSDEALYRAKQAGRARVERAD